MSYPEPPPIPGYEPVRPLGINLGEYYLVRHSSSGALVVLKVFGLAVADRIRDQDACSARLHHPNIIRVFEMGEFEGRYFCALEFIERALAERLRDGPLLDVEVARIARAAGSALLYAHDQGMVPRSLSPKSILLTHENVPKLLDFCASEVFGKPPNLPPTALRPPEWASGAETASETGLVHCMGALMYEMLTARAPFTADGVEATAMRVLHEMPARPRKANPRVGRELDALCMKCLAKQPKARYVSLQDLLDRIYLTTLSHLR